MSAGKPDRSTRILRSGWLGVLLVVAYFAYSWSQRHNAEVLGKRPPQIQLIRAEYAKGNYPEAILLADEILVWKSKDPDLLAARADAKRAAGDLSGARLDYENALNNAPADWPSLEAVRAALVSMK